MVRAPDTLKPYEPTLRNRISTALLGDAKASSVRGRFVKGLMGDTGLSATGLGIVDLLPFLQADEAGRQLATKGQRGAGATNLALSVIPIPAVANKLVKPAVKKAAKGVARLIGDVVGEAAPSVSKIADALEGAAQVPKTKTPNPFAGKTEAELQTMDVDELDRFAFGHADGDVVQLKPSDINIQYPDDLVNPEDRFAKKGMEWAKSVDLSEPIKVQIKDDGKMYLADGHHRWFAAQKTGRPLTAEVEIKGNPVRRILEQSPAASPPIPVPVVGGPPRNAEGFSAPLDMSQEARMARAAEQGFTTPVFHGTASPTGDAFESYDLNRLGSNTRQGEGELGVFSSAQPWLADNYAEIAGRGGWGGGTPGAPYVRPELARLRNPKRYATASEFYRDAEARKTSLNNWRADLQSEGYDGVVVRPDGEEVVVFHPGDLRSTFDPFHPGGEARVGLPRPGDYKVGGSLPPVPVVMPRAASGSAAPPVPVTQPQITAYHGSPHDFDQFSLDKIGTGEGAQAYGHGLYFAENEGVAQSYRDALGPKPYIHNGLADGAWDDPTFRAATAIHANKGEDGALAVLRGNAQSPRNDATINAILDGSYKKHEMPTGSMYQVGINADPEHFLDWDAPLSQQSELVQNAARTADVSHLSPGSRSRVMMDWFRNGTEQPQAPMTGAHLVSALNTEAVHSPETAKYLAEQGIPGIKYLDNGSRNAGGWHITPPSETVSGKWMVKGSDYNSKGLQFDTEAEAKAALAEKIGGQTRNFVVFDEKLITILKKYGWVPGAALPAAAIAEYTKENGSPPPTVPMV